tara:strand:- start:251 stop:472 length:222 start_codon:yes stop_codon:yes gene_type:complete
MITVQFTDKEIRMNYNGFTLTFSTEKNCWKAVRETPAARWVYANVNKEELIKKCEDFLPRADALHPPRRRRFN